ncbi:MAG: hypothetical protein COW61_01050 [Candidatus Yonathbacteria bacterium CG17_big_fil_post_rev_8_21_14_2_50_46_19]|uniref:DUF4349 domain-containing protein n=1 Tax=Candidatus Nomurabacteria bacterium CG1_02_47_685 TaxID=1805282 RepID=A0A1J4VDX3_9BACT|nr:MAG: hypothetical protein AUJ44_02480 [Candidatus Nomurabacteria bacterium CG1_02_47_685]PIQ32738.1 MAG: hypothetical protein COW61_01050 [Candidatus Yonathbacteria bacterium CG17_big_fil_post_rev_8_21_14_2_50_46_19]PJC67583.1 MAG: hypothetical protein CO016_01050 [Candidatus Yonathbacteria bacterium CG_4_8_14_3_um_filter_46_25]
MNTKEARNLVIRNKKPIIASGVTTVVVFVIVLAVLGVMGGRPGPFQYDLLGMDSKTVSYDTGFMGRGMEGDVTSSVNVPVPTSPSVVTDRKVINNASLSLVVKKTDDAVEDIKSIARKHGGFVENANIYITTGDRKAGSVAIRVPATNFDAAVAEIKTIAVTIEREDINASDVTEQFIDYEARLKNLKAEETQYAEILKRATKIDDIVTITDRLADLRGRIESQEGQLKYLSQQVDLSTIHVGLISEADVEVFGVVWSPLVVVKLAIKDALASLVGYMNFIIAVMFHLPIIILWILTVALVLLVLWKIGKKVWWRWFNK